MNYNSIIKISKLPIYFLFFGLLSGCAQQKHKNESITFYKHIGDMGKSRGVTVEQTKDLGYILVGYTTNGLHGSEDVLLIKTNAHGEILWKKTFGGKGEDYGWAVRQNDDEGYIISGYTNSFGNGAMDAYLIKTNSKGEKIWSKTFGREKDEYGWDVRITKDKGFIIAAQTNSFGNGEVDAYLIKVDDKGNELWSKTYGGHKTDRIFSVQESDDGTFIASGITYSYSSVNANDRDGYLIKTDANGNELWHKTFGGDAYDVVHCVTLTKDNGYMFTGYGESFSKQVGRDVYLLKTDHNGNIQWQKSYGENADERGLKGEQTNDGGFIAIGFTDKDLNMYMLKTDTLGNKLWSRTFGDIDKLEFGYTVKQAHDGGYIAIGHSEDKAQNISSVLLIKTNDLGEFVQK